MFRNPVGAVTVVVVFLGLWAFARTPPWVSRGVPRYIAKTVMAAIHTFAQVLAVVAVALLAITVASAVADGCITTTASVVRSSPVGWWVVFGAYLAAANGLPGIRPTATRRSPRPASPGTRTSCACTSTRRSTHRLRHRDRAGPRHDWRPDPDNDDPEASWLVPVGASART